MMIRRNLDKALRIVLACACAVMIFSLTAQCVNLRRAITSAREAFDLKAELELEMDFKAGDSDLARFDDLASKSHLFRMPPKQEPPPPSLNGLIGGQAILNGNLHKVGDKINGWEVAAITSNGVEITKDGQKQKLTMFPEQKGLVIDNRSKGQKQGEKNPPGFKGGPKMASGGADASKKPPSKGSRAPGAAPPPVVTFGSAPDFSSLPDVQFVIDGSPAPAPQHLMQLQMIL